MSKQISNTSTEILNKLQTQLSENGNNSEELTLVHDLRKELSSERRGSIILLLLVILVSIIFNLTTLLTSPSSEEFDRNRYYLERADSILRKITGRSVMEGFYFYSDSNDNILTYEQLYSTKDSLQTRIFELENALYMQQLESDMIKMQYPIRVIHKNNKYWVEAPQIDSAMMLLPVYRNRLEYDQKENVWQIK